MIFMVSIRDAKKYAKVAFVDDGTNRYAFYPLERIWRNREDEQLDRVYLKIEEIEKTLILDTESGNWCDENYILLSEADQQWIRQKLRKMIEDSNPVFKRTKHPKGHSLISVIIKNMHHLGDKNSHKT